ncbi:MAG: M48 family metalloprotease [Actinoplanes sp.]
MTCPSCAADLVAARGATSWCPSCEWNLNLFEPQRRRPEIGWRWADRATHRIAWRLTTGQFAALVGGPIERRRWSPARAVTMTVAVLLLAFVAACAVAGVWLILYDFPRFTILPGVALLGVAIVCRPRFGGHPDLHVLNRDDAPELFALIDRVAALAGAPVPHIVGVDESLGAYTSAVGWRRRRLLCIGAPLWAALDPQERVALLGHELGHFVNGDLRRAPLESMALSTLGRLAYLTQPGESGVNGFVDMLVGAVQWVLSRLFTGLHLLIVWIGQRDAQRAEYLADEIGARAAGSAAAVRLEDVLLMQDALETVILRESRAKRGGAHWAEAARVARANLAPTVPVLRQLSRRDEVSLFASHPPSGLRALMLERRPQHAAGVVLTEQQSERIDAELAGPVEQIRRELASAY